MRTMHAHAHSKPGHIRGLLYGIVRLNAPNSTACQERRSPQRIHRLCQLSACSGAVCARADSAYGVGSMQTPSTTSTKADTVFAGRPSVVFPRHVERLATRSGQPGAIPPTQVC